MTKSIFVSYTFWFGFLQLALGVVGFISGMLSTNEAFGLIVTGAGTIGLRIKTDKPVTVFPK